MDLMLSLYASFDASLWPSRANITKINLVNRKYLFWIQNVTDSLITVLIFIATCSGVKTLKTYPLLNAVLQTDSATDTLTRLVNRRLFLVWASPALGRTTRGESRLAILFIDLKSFKKINDTSEHQADDKVFHIVASRLSSLMRSSDFLARIGGYEFSVLISGGITKDGLSTFQQHIAETISATFIDGTLKGTRVTASFGCAIYPENGTTIEALLGATNTDMYKIILNPFPNIVSENAKS